MAQAVTAALFLVLIAVAVNAWRRRRIHGGIGPGAGGAVYDLLTADRRAALEVVVEERASYRDPEERDGDLPQLQKR